MYFNVPQSRQRMIFIGVRNDLQVLPSHPSAESSPFGVALPHTRTESQRITEHNVRVALAHKARHLAKGHGFGYQVLSKNKPSPTWPKTMMVSTSAPRYVDHGVHWLPSAIEMSAIGSYPQEFRFFGTYAEQWERIGNSVPPLFMRAIAEHIRAEILGKIPAQRRGDSDRCASSSEIAA
jgi:DNA (cytosine-5)-methyltransferase 1